jgi:uncharacterized membrane protein YGL010W
MTISKEKLISGIKIVLLTYFILLTVFNGVLLTNFFTEVFHNGGVKSLLLIWSKPFYYGLCFIAGLLLCGIIYLINKKLIKRTASCYLKNEIFLLTESFVLFWIILAITFSI